MNSALAANRAATTSCAVGIDHTSHSAKNQNQNNQNFFHKHPNPLAQLVFERRYPEAWKLANADRPWTDEHHYWLAMLELNVGRLERAEQHLRQTDHAGKLGLLAAVKRLQNQSRDSLLLELDREAYARREPLERAQLERETAWMHFDREDWTTALYWFERAWNTCLNHPLWWAQCGALGHDYAQALERNGFDQKAIEVLKIGLEYADPSRQAKMMFRLALCYAHLGVFGAALMHLKSPQTIEEKMYAHYIHGLMHRDNINAALVFFGLCHELAHRQHSDLEFYAAMQIYALNPEAVQLSEVPVKGERQQAWLAWFTAKRCLEDNQLEDAFVCITEAISRFSYQHLHRELGQAHLLLAEVHARRGDLQRMERELERAKAQARIMGSGAALSLEACQYHNVRFDAPPIEPARIVVYAAHITVDGVPVRHRHRQAVVLFKHCLQHRQTTMDAMLEAVGSFDSNWVHQLKWWLCREVTGFRLEYDRHTKVYCTSIEGAVQFAK